MNRKAFDIDWDSIDAVTKAFCQLRTRKCELEKPNRTSKKENNRRILDSCMSILNSDISSAFSDYKNLDVSNKYYVYAHCDPHQTLNVKNHSFSAFMALIGMNCRPFYIGKGIGNRAHDLNRNDTHRKVRQRIKQLGKDVEVFIIKRDLSELDALMLESKLIDIFGLVSKYGSLVNLDEGYNSIERRKLYGNDLEIISNRKNRKTKKLVVEDI